MIEIREIQEIVSKRMVAAGLPPVDSSTRRRLLDSANMAERNYNAKGDGPAYAAYCAAMALCRADVLARTTGPITLRAGYEVVVLEGEAATARLRRDIQRGLEALRAGNPLPNPYRAWAVR